MDLDSIAVDPALLDCGVWWDFHTKEPCDPKTRPHAEHFCLLIVPYGNDYSRAEDELRVPHMDEVRRNKGKLPESLVATIRGAALARAVVKDWANAEMSGESLPFSVAKAAELLSSPRWTLLRKFVDSAASNESALLAQEEAAAAKN